MLSYLVRSDFMDSSLVSSGSYIFSWMPNRRFLPHFVLREETALGLECCSERLSASFYYSNLFSTLSKCKQIHSVLCPPTVVFVSLKTSIKSNLDTEMSLLWFSRMCWMTVRKSMFGMMYLNRTLSRNNIQGGNLRNISRVDVKIELRLKGQVNIKFFTWH